jgi:hypothetical protein
MMEMLDETPENHVQSDYVAEVELIAVYNECNDPRYTSFWRRILYRQANYWECCDFRVYT